MKLEFSVTESAISYWTPKVSLPSLMMVLESSVPSNVISSMNGFVLQISRRKMTHCPHCSPVIMSAACLSPSSPCLLVVSTAVKAWPCILHHLQDSTLTSGKWSLLSPRAFGLFWFLFFEAPVHLKVINFCYTSERREKSPPIFTTAFIRNSLYVLVICGFVANYKARRSLWRVVGKSWNHGTKVSLEQEDRSTSCHPKMIIFFFSVSKSITDLITISNIFSYSKKQASKTVVLSTDHIGKLSQ